MAKKLCLKGLSEERMLPIWQFSQVWNSHCYLAAIPKLIKKCEMIQEKGNISIHTENIFPIIKKFLYSDHEIFLRELVSNAVDATQKIKRLAASGQYNKELGDLRVEVAVDEKPKP